MCVTTRKVVCFIGSTTTITNNLYGNPPKKVVFVLCYFTIFVDNIHTLMENNNVILSVVERLKKDPQPIFMPYKAAEMKITLKHFGSYAVKPVRGGCLVANMNSFEDNPLLTRNRVKKALQANVWPQVIASCKATYVREYIWRQEIKGFKVVQNGNDVAIYPNGFKIAPITSNALMSSELLPKIYDLVIDELQRLAEAAYMKVSPDKREGLDRLVISDALPEDEEDKIGPPDAGIFMKRPWEDDEERI
jgi:hypothetical protein